MRIRPDFLVSALFACLLGLSSPVSAKPYTVWLGTFGRGAEQGIHRATLDPETGKLSPPAKAADLSGAGFLAIAPDGKHFYATTDAKDADGKRTGGVAALRRKEDGALEVMNVQPTGGGVCHVSVHPSGKCLFAANYGGGSVVSFPIKEDGSLGPRASFIQNEGKGPNASRQEGPHAHSITTLPGGRFAAAPDLGIDKVMIYEINTATAALTPHNFAATRPGSGPRHLAVAPDGKTVFVVGELDQSVSTFTWDAEKGALTTASVAEGRPAGWEAKDLTSAEVRVRPDARFVYSSTRDLSDQRRDFLTVFRLGQGGVLTPIQHQKAVVGFPRNFNITPDGRWIVAGGERSNTLQVFSVEAATGQLAPVGEPVACPSPVCVVFE